MCDDINILEHYDVIYFIQQCLYVEGNMSVCAMCNDIYTL